jgi:hypothetical protein
VTLRSHDRPAQNNSSRAKPHISQTAPDRHFGACYGSRRSGVGWGPCHVLMPSG